MQKQILLLALLFLLGKADAQNETLQKSKLFQTVLNQLHLKEKSIHTNLYCEKILPYAKDKTVVVLPQYTADSNMDEPEFTLNAYVLIVDNTSGKILQKYYETNAWTSDAIRLDDISIDTGIYTVTGNKRAFGIRVHYTGSSGPNPYGQATLSLYIPQEDTVKRILANYSVYEYHGDWDTKCAGEFTATQSFIDIDKQHMNNNFYNLTIKDKIEKTTSTPKKDDCIDKKQPTQYKTKTLQYNGKEYILMKEN